MNKISIIMYHYVRDLKKSRYPEIKGLDTSLFEEQVKYMKKYYNIISAVDFLDALEGKESLPKNSLLLTFDDGYLDHFTQVMPILDKYDISGLFFPPAKCILEHEVLDVNKIHFLLASVVDKSLIVKRIYDLMNTNKDNFKLETNEFYWKKYAIPNRFDTAEIIFIKRMLQKGLPLALSRIILNELFNEFVTKDEEAFASELYMSIEQIRYLQSNNMYVGSHGYEHFWLNSLSKDQQEYEVEQSLSFLKAVNSDINRWIMCYPYGGYDEKLLNLLKSKNCKVGLSTKVGIANLTEDNILALPRLDTNDLPKDKTARPNEWTKKIL